MSIRSWPLGLGGVLVATLMVASPQTASAGTILQFQGGGQAQTEFIPSDMGGAVGDGYVTQMVNGVVSFFNANTGHLVQQTTLDGFWGNLGVQTNPSQGNFMSDPRVVFDPSTNRWFTAAITTAAVNQVDLAVSNNGNPTSGFKAVSFSAAKGLFYDYPTLGVNHGAVTIGTNNFGATSGAFDSSGIFSIPKADLLGAKPTLAHMTQFNNLPISDFTNQPVTDLYGHGNSTTVLTSINSTSINGFYGVQALKLNNVGSASATLTAGASYLNPGDVAGLVNPIQPGGTAYDANDPRISASPVQVGKLIYFTNSISYGTTDRVYWGVVNATNQNLVRSGVVSIKGLDLTFPSIAANGGGTFVIGFNGSGPHTNISAYDVTCSIYSGACGTPSQLYAGQGNNYVGYTINGQQDVRWGDYSAIVNDPSNSNNFWLFQDYVTSQNLWGTVITEINVPEPGSLLLLATGLLGLVLVRRRRPIR